MQDSRYRNPTGRPDGAILLFALFFSLVCCFRVTGQSGVTRQWDVTEVTLTAESDYNNPYREVEVSATFTGPEGQTLSLRGFWDGGRTYRLRFTPPAPGRWHYRIENNQQDGGLTGQGEILVEPDDGPGFVRRDSAHPYHFVHDDGSPYFMFGTTYYDLMLNAMAGDRWQEAIDSARYYGINKVRMNGHPMHSEKSYYPFVDGFVTVSTDSVNTDRLNIDYWQKLDEVIVYAAERGMKVDLMPFGIHRTYYAPTVGEDEQYLRYVIARYAAYPNVLWTLINEWNYRTRIGIDKPYWNHMGQLLRDEDPWQTDRGGAPRPLSIHQQTRIDWQFLNYAWPSHIILQVGVRTGQGTVADEWDLTAETQPAYREGDAWGNAGILYNRGHELPVVNDEYGYIGEPRDRAAATDRNDKESWPRLTRERHRNIIWGIYLAGGYGSAGDKNAYPDGNPYFSANWHPAPEYEDIKHLIDFFTTLGLPYRRMQPSNELVDAERVYLLAEAGRHYLFYDASGSAFQATVEPGDYSLLRFNPATGSSQEETITVGPEGINLTKPPQAGHDRVIYLKRQ